MTFHLPGIRPSMVRWEGEDAIPAHQTGSKARRKAGSPTKTAIRGIYGFLKAGDPPLLKGRASHWTGTPRPPGRRRQGRPPSGCQLPAGDPPCLRLFPDDHQRLAGDGPAPRPEMGAPRRRWLGGGHRRRWHRDRHHPGHDQGSRRSGGQGLWAGPRHE